ncbi:hypothetical protein CCR97_11150 [Rhodoplanes elegans]|uniref:HTH cro/C1-type domain-containing protein n=2 Tax=Rhodoplanes elegans TaxID=29408 RepID=A0A327K974_9BRAD|nr:S24 family peptidase [Rhodoplanes elegans]MBK5958762.1 hypothetical protein [Rhodoplanes elegans]RAI34506.1 hypothetical protein CH338_20755 [Rhodoplanes elegans]
MRLNTAIKGAGGKARIYRETGIPVRTLNNYTSATVEPTALTLAKLAEVCRVSTDWLLSGVEAPVGSGPSAAAEKQAISGASDDVDRLIPIQRLAFRAAAGNGVLVVDEDAGWTSFPAGTLQRIHVKPENARLMIAAGDSMRPTLEDGDPLLVDISDTEIIDGRVYVFSIGDQALVKRLRRRGAKLVMRSDNREHFPDEEEVPMVEPVRIIGRVRWVGRSL